MANLFDNGEWQARWNSTESDFSAIDSTSPNGGAYIELAPANAGRRAISWDDTAYPRDVEILGLVRAKTFDTEDNGSCRLVAHGLEDENGVQGYMSELRNGGFAISRYIDGNFTILTSDNNAPTADTWYWVRFRVTNNGFEDNRLQMRYWQDGNAEPTTWDFDITDTDADAPDYGWAGLGGYANDTQQFDWFSVGAGGLTAESPSTKTATASGTGVGTGSATPSRTRAVTATGLGVGNGIAIAGQTTTTTYDIGAYGGNTYGTTPYASTIETGTVKVTTASGTGAGAGTATATTTASAVAAGAGVGTGSALGTKIKLATAVGAGVGTGSASAIVRIEKTELIGLTNDVIANWPYDFQPFSVTDPHGQYLKAYTTEILEIKNQLELLYDSRFLESATGQELEKLAEEVSVNRVGGEADDKLRYKARLDKAVSASNGDGEEIETILGIAFDGRSLSGVVVTHVSGDPITRFEVPSEYMDDVPITTTELEDYLERAFPCGHGVEVVLDDTWRLGQSGATGLGNGGLL